jgi:hypothetical protein
MTKIYIYLLSIALFTSCTPTLNYLGNSYEPTKSVDVYVDESAITKEYTIMGKGYVHFYSEAVPESIQQKAISKAKQKGADAVLFKDYFVPVAQTQSRTRTKKDSTGGVTVSISNPTQVQNASPEVVVYFLKYK